MAMNSSFRRSASSSARLGPLAVGDVLDGEEDQLVSPSGGKRRALRSIVFGPMCSKSCSTSKSSNDGVPRDDLLEQRPQGRDVPLAVPQVVDESAFGLGGVTWKVS